MKSKTITAPRPLDLETLGRVNGGCQLVVVPEAQPQSTHAAGHADSGLAFAASNAWSSLAGMGSFTMDHHASDFMRADLQRSSQDAPPEPVHIAPHEHPTEAAAASTESPSASDHSDAPDAPAAPIELHCGTTTPTSSR